MSCNVVCVVVMAAAFLMAGCVLGDYEVRVAFHSYLNPTSGCQDCTLATGEVFCCDNSLNLLTCRAEDQCDNLFVVCLRELGLSANRGAESLCLTAPSVTGTLTDGDNIDFSREEFANFSSLMLFEKRGAWQGVQVYIAVLDDDIVPGQSSQDDLVDRFTVNLNSSVVPGVSFTDETLYAGFFGFGQLELSFRVSCAENFFGSDCATECNNSTGVNCATNIDDCEGVDCGNGTCQDTGAVSFVCQCDPGFTGEQCSAEIDECQGIDCSGNGQCIDELASFSCDCDAGFTGELCNIRDAALSNNTTAIIGGILGALVLLSLIVIVVLTLVIIVLVSRKPKPEKNTKVQMTTMPPTSNGVQLERVEPQTSAITTMDYEIPLPSRVEETSQRGSNTQEDTGSYVEIYQYNRASRIEDELTYDYVP